MKAEELQLIEPAYSGAIMLQTKYPGISFISGRRTRSSQAHAMAVNTLQNRDWIKETYRNTTETRALQQWLDRNPQAASFDDLFKGFYDVLELFSDAELAEWNHHFAGLAFDVQPQTENAEAIKQDIRFLPHLNLFLEKEGGLVRWHAQFDPI